MENVYLFLGEEELIIRNKIDKEIISSGADMFNVKSYDMEEVNVSKAINDALTPPFLCDSKVIILKNPIFLTKETCEIKHSLKSFTNYLKDPSPFTVLIIDATDLSLDESKEHVKLLLKTAQVSTTKKLSPIEARGWLKRQFDLVGIQIKPETVDLFFKRMGENLINAKSEVDKVLCYIGDRKVVTNKDVDDCVIREIENEVYALTNAILAQDKSKIMTLYEDIIKSGKSTQEIFSSIARGILNTLVAKKMMREGYKQDDVAAALKVKSGRAYHIMKNAKENSWQVLEDAVSNLGDLDYKIKSGQVEASTGLEFLLFGIANKKTSY